MTRRGGKPGARYSPPGGVRPLTQAPVAPDLPGAEPDEATVPDVRGAAVLLRALVLGEREAPSVEAMDIEAALRLLAGSVAICYHLGRVQLSEPQFLAFLDEAAAYPELL